jgi:hypothetical protein
VNPLDDTPVLLEDPPEDEVDTPLLDEPPDVEDDAPLPDAEV